MTIFNDPTKNPRQDPPNNDGLGNSTEINKKTSPNALSDLQIRNLMSQYCSYLQLALQSMAKYYQLTTPGKYQIYVIKRMLNQINEMGKLHPNLPKFVQDSWGVDPTSLIKGFLIANDKNIYQTSFFDVK